MSFHPMRGRVLITGVSGFAGRYLAPWLAARGYDVFGTSMNAEDTPVGVMRMFRLDIRRAEQVDVVVHEVMPQRVVHLAAISSATHGDINEIYDTNLIGSRNLLSSLKGLANRPARVVLASSATVYGNADRARLDEEAPLRPMGDYGASKAAMEMMAHQFADDLNIVIVRPFNYTGRGQDTRYLIPRIAEHVRRRAEIVELGVRDIVLDISDVRSVIAYIGRLLESDVPAARVYNICSGTGVSLSSVIDACERLTGHRLSIEINPAFVRRNDIKTFVGNPERLHATVGSCEPIPLETTLAWMLEREVF